jgi:hypothetical protein
VSVEIERTPQGCNVAIRTRGAQVDIVLWTGDPELEERVRGRESFYPGLDR